MLSMLYFGQAKPLLDAKLVKEIADPRLEDKYDPSEMRCAMATASMCIHHKSSKRPYMNQVTKLGTLWFGLHLLLPFS
jgi:hypothetical protein